MSDPHEPGQAFVSDTVSRLNAALEGSYRIERILGEGGMATVYLARDVRHERKVALKVLRPELAAAIGADRFLAEIRTTANLQHPHILPLFDSGAADGFLFYVMPYVEGETLGDLIDRDGQLPIKEALGIASDVAEALDHAHRAGVVHRDVKPANILLQDGRPVVADFGIALALDRNEAEKLTASGFTVGTTGYMSPEQAAGDEKVDLRTDLYSLGCTLYEMLAGERPFTGSTAKVVLAKQLQLPPPSVRVIRAAVHPAVDEVIRRALATASADRFDSAGALVSALKAAEEGRFEGVQPTRTSVSSQRRIAARRGASILGVVGAAYLLFRLVPPPPPPISLDDNKVVVFQLSDAVGGTGPGGDVAVWVHGALDHAAPIRAIDGWARLSPAQRDNIALLDRSEARGIAMMEEARFYMLGRYVEDSDSIRISLQLYDVQGDSLFASGDGAGDTGEFSRFGVAHTAFLRLLPGWLDPDHQSSVDLSPLTERTPSAVALWVAGEREYRESRFSSAFDRYRGALEADSLMVFAAVKGALAARWIDRTDSARALVSTALSRQTALPARYRRFSRALDHYLSGRGTEASDELRAVLDDYPDWSEAWMALGETYYHLFPANLTASSADDAFAEARRFDPSFTPPLYHLTEIAARNGRAAEADSLRDLYVSFNPDSHRQRVLDLVVTCVRDGPSQTDWRTAALAQPLAVLDAAQSLSARGASLECARAGFSEVHLLQHAEHGWGALIGLTSVLLAQGRSAEVRQLLDDAAAGRIGLSARLLHVMAALSGAPMNDRADEVDAIARSLFGPSYQGAQPPTLWLLGVWNASQGRKDRVRQLIEALSVAPDDQEMADRYRAALTAHLAALEGDISGAIAGLSAARPAAAPSDLAWGYAEPLAYEQITLARLLFDAGDAEGAIRAAALLDHQQPIMYVAFLPASLELRHAAARVAGDSRQENFDRRLKGLQRRD